MALGSPLLLTTDKAMGAIVEKFIDVDYMV
jgi:hypothetical protein